MMSLSCWRLRGAVLRFGNVVANNGNKWTTASRGLKLWQTYPSTKKQQTDQYFRLPGWENNVLFTYVWIDGTGVNLRAKTRVIEKQVETIAEIPKWHYDGSSTYQATGEASDMHLEPVAWCKDPFLQGQSKLILCETYVGKDTPSKNNWRHKCAKAIEQCKDFKPWFAFEQEYTFLGYDGMPLGFPELGYPGPQGPYYCGVGAGKVSARDIADAHMLACLYAGLKMGGTNAEVLLGQWEYQIGPCGGLEVGDELWLSRYILERIAEEYGVAISYDPKPVEGDWNGTGNHCNFSTEAMRQPGGIKYIYEAIEKLRERHRWHMEEYDPSGGVDNKRRMTGRHETASHDEFTFGEGSRNTSVRIPRPVVTQQMGWLEDRRPSANCDPYAVVNRLLRTICLNE